MKSEEHAAGGDGAAGGNGSGGTTGGMGATGGEGGTRQKSHDLHLQTGRSRQLYSGSLAHQPMHASYAKSDSKPESHAAGGGDTGGESGGEGGASGRGTTGGEGGTRQKSHDLHLQTGLSRQL